MKCPNCGAGTELEDSFCPECGGRLREDMKAFATSGYAIASLVFGILFFIPFAPLLAILFGIIAFVKIHNDQNLSGKGMAIMGIILGFLFIFLIFLLVKNASTVTKMLGPIIITIMKTRL